MFKRIVVNQIIVLFFFGFFSHCTFAQINVGIYENSAGAKGIYEGLKGEKDLQVEMVKSTRLTLDNLLRYDVLVIGSLKGMEQRSVQSIRNYVNIGGSALLHHDACGYRDWKEPLFPDVCRGIRVTRMSTLVPLFDTRHPLLRNISREYTHAYYDHIVLGKGPKGTVIVEDKEGTPAVIIGEIGYGRVVANGSITGYWSELDTQRQGEGAPKDEELKVLLNAVSWLGEKPVTKFAGEELNKRKKLYLAEIAEMQLTESPSSANSSWFSDDMLRGSFLIRQPAIKADGKFFLFHDVGFIGRYMDREQMRVYLRQLKWLGVTDIVYGCDLKSGIGHHTDIPARFPGIEIAYGFEKRSSDPLLDMLKIARDEGLDVWVMWHPGAVPDNMAACDQQGKKYVHPSYNNMVDVLSSDYRRLCHALIDEYAVKYNVYGNFKGIYYDELFFNCIDFHGDDISLFNRFCQENFGETLPGDISDKLAKKVAWVDPSDKWWRRYILFKNHANTGFIKDLADYCHGKKLGIIVELRPTARLNNGWSYGIDNEAFTHLGADYYYVASADYCEPCYVYPNALVGGHVGNTWGYYNTVSLRGHSASMHFVDNQIRRLTFGNNPNGLAQLQRLICNTREWANSENLARVAVLHNQNSLQMLLGNGAPEAALQELQIADKLSFGQDVDMLLVGAREYYKNYKLLLAPTYALRGIPQETFAAVERYVKAGGTLVMLGNCSVSLPDLTRKQDKTADLAGIGYSDKSIEVAALTYKGKEVKLSSKATIRQVDIISLEANALAGFGSTEMPAVTSCVLGKGKVIGIHFDIARELGRNNKEIEAYISSLVKEQTDPAITTTGGLKIMTTLKKGNWVAVSLYADSFPARGVVTVDLKKLGLNKKGYRVLMLGKGMELSRPGDFWGKTGHWKTEDIASGIPVTITADNDEKLALPDKFDLSSFSQEDAGYIDTITRAWWNTVGEKKRRYEHEILVIAPYDEPAIQGK